MGPLDRERDSAAVHLACGGDRSSCGPCCVPAFNQAAVVAIVASDRKARNWRLRQTRPQPPARSLDRGCRRPARTYRVCIGALLRNAGYAFDAIAGLDAALGEPRLAHLERVASGCRRPRSE